MLRLKLYLIQTVKNSIRSSLLFKMKQFQQKLTDLNVQKAMKEREMKFLREHYEKEEHTLNVIDSNNYSMCSILSNRQKAVKTLDRIEQEIHEIELSLQMIEQMKDELQCEIIMLKRVI